MTHPIINAMAAEIMSRCNAPEAEIYAAARAAYTAHMDLARKPSNTMLEVVGPMEGFADPSYDEGYDRPHIEWWQAMHDQQRKEVLPDATD